jgi:hypothetical protein
MADDIRALLRFGWRHLEATAPTSGILGVRGDLEAAAPVGRMPGPSLDLEAELRPRACNEYRCDRQPVLGPRSKTANPPSALPSSRSSRCGFAVLSCLVTWPLARDSPKPSARRLGNARSARSKGYRAVPVAHGGRPRPPRCAHGGAEASALRGREAPISAPSRNRNSSPSLFSRDRSA